MKIISIFLLFKFLEQQTERTEEEKSQLIEQLHNLVQQNQNVLTQALSNKDIFHEEARGYLYVLKIIIKILKINSLILIFLENNFIN